MKIAKFFAGIFGAIGTVLLVGSIGLCLFSLNAPVRMSEMPAGAVECSEQLAEAISQKDYAALEGCIYGQPQLGMEGTIGDTMVFEIWNVFENNLTFSYQGECYVKDAAIFRDATVTYLEVASVTEKLQTRAHTLLTQKVEAATDMAELYDESGEFREDLVIQVLYEALDQACQEDAHFVTQNVTVELVHRDGQWWAVPDGSLLTALSGGLA